MNPDADGDLLDAPKEIPEWKRIMSDALSFVSFVDSHGTAHADKDVSKKRARLGSDDGEQSRSPTVEVVIKGDTFPELRVSWSSVLPLLWLQHVYSKFVGVESHTFVILLSGQYIGPDDTPDRLGLDNDDEIELCVFARQC